MPPAMRRFHDLISRYIPLLLSSFVTAIQAADMVPMVLPWDDSSDTLISLADWSHQPAGKYGYLHANEDGELMAGNRRCRLWGVNLTSSACFPTHEDADRIAARMAKFGINIVRFHHMNANWSGSETLIDYSQGNSRSLRASTLDRLDYLVYQLKLNGIYTNLNLLVSRVFFEADGLPGEIAQVGWKESHTIGYFNDRHLALQKEFATQLLSHVNPYTGLAYKDDPAVAVVEILNENSLFKAWFSGDLDGWPAIFQNEVTPAWNAWLAEKYGSTAELKEGWGFVDEPLGPQVLTNGDLRLGDTSGWFLEQHEGATGTMELLENAYFGQPALRITVIQPGSAGWHIQPKYTPVELVEGQLYTLRFAARGSNGQPFSLNISRDYDPWTSVGVQQSLTLTPEWQNIELTFRAGITDHNLRIACNGFATSQGWADICGLSLRPGGTMGELPEGTSLEAGNIPWPRLAENGGAAPGEMMRDWFRFLLYREKHYISEMEAHVRETLGYPGLVLGTQTGYAPVEALAGLSTADGHSYWDHPQFPGSGWDPYNWSITNESMVNSPPGTLGQLAMRRVAGIPYTVSEYQHAYPNVHAAEAPVLIGAYAALQNWDGIYFFNYGNTRDDWDRGFFNTYFDISVHPAAMANMILGAALFRRQDVRPANTAYTYSSPSERFFSEMLGNSDGFWISAVDEFDFDASNALVHRLGIDRENVNGESGLFPPDIDGSVIPSDTGELVWDDSAEGKGIVRIDTAMTKALVGFVDGRAFDLGGIIVSPRSNRLDWLTFGLVAMEGKGILAADGSRCLLVATGECGNAGMQWNAERTTLAANDWGHSPSLVEVIPATVDLPVRPERVRAWALDPTGARSGELTVEPHGEGTRITIGLPWQTLWYELEIAPAPSIETGITVIQEAAEKIAMVRFQIQPYMDPGLLRVETSIDLNNWSQIPAEALEWSSSPDGSQAVVRDALPAGPRKFYRAMMAM